MLVILAIWLGKSFLTLFYLFVVRDHSQTVRRLYSKQIVLVQIVLKTNFVTCYLLHFGQWKPLKIDLKCYQILPFVAFAFPLTVFMQNVPFHITIKCLLIKEQELQTKICLCILLCSSIMLALLLKHVYFIIQLFTYAVIILIYYLH